MGTDPILTEVVLLYVVTAIRVDRGPEPNLPCILSRLKSNAHQVFCPDDDQRRDAEPLHFRSQSEAYAALGRWCSNYGSANAPAYKDYRVKCAGRLVQTVA